MKTLEEVIDDFEKACDLERRCENCSGCLGQENGCPNDGAESIPDALHYLKDYRMLVNNIAEKRQELEAEITRYQEAVRNCEEAENKFRKMEDELNDIRREHIEQMKNPPLSWDELKTMEGKPVWVEDENQPSQWYLIDEVETDEDDDPEFVSMTVFDCQGDYWFYKNNMGTKWQAYSKERK